MITFSHGLIHSQVKAKANLRLQSRSQDAREVKSSGQELLAVKAPIWAVKDLDPGRERMYVGATPLIQLGFLYMEVLIIWRFHSTKNVKSDNFIINSGCWRSWDFHRNSSHFCRHSLLFDKVSHEYC